MKPALLFFLILCVHLFGGFEGARASSGNHSGFKSTVQCYGNKLALPTNQQTAVHQNATLEMEVGYFILDEDEEEITRKLQSLVKYYSTFCQAANSFYFRNDPDNQLYFSRSLPYKDSCKYIEQRVLKI